MNDNDHDAAAAAAETSHRKRRAGGLRVWRDVVNRLTGAEIEQPLPPFSVQPAKADGPSAESTWLHRPDSMEQLDALVHTPRPPSFAGLQYFFRLHFTIYNLDWGCRQTLTNTAATATAAAAAADQTTSKSSARPGRPQANVCSKSFAYFAEVLYHT